MLLAIGQGVARVCLVAAALCVVLLPGLASAMTSEPASVYVKVDYMQLTDSTPREYFALELGEWRPIHEQRIRQGVTTAWYFYEMMPGARKDADQPYDYITISVFDSYDEVIGEGGTEAIFAVYPGVDLGEMYARADEARSFVRSDLWKLTAVTSPDTDAKPVGPYLLFRFYDSAGGDGCAEAERAIHEARIAAGEMKGAATLRLVNAEDEERPYGFASVTYFDSLLDLLAPVDAERLLAAYPEMAAADVEALLERTAEAHAPYKEQVWRLIDAIEGPVEDLE